MIPICFQFWSVKKNTHGHAPGRSVPWRKSCRRHRQHMIPLLMHVRQHPRWIPVRRRTSIALEGGRDKYTEFVNISGYIVKMGSEDV